MKNFIKGWFIAFALFALAMIIMLLTSGCSAIYPNSEGKTTYVIPLGNGGYDYVTMKKPLPL